MRERTGIERENTAGDEGTVWTGEREDLRNREIAKEKDRSKSRGEKLGRR